MRLPKAILKYCKPDDRGHEVRLCIVWRYYRLCIKDPEITDADRHVAERDILGGVFHIPEAHWKRFRLKEKSDTVTLAQLMKQLQKLNQPNKPSRPPKHSPQLSHKPQRPKKPTIIIRRANPNPNP